MEKLKNNEEKKSWGGRREGAGRPCTNSKLYTFRAPGDMAEYIDAQSNKTEFIKGCIEKEMVSVGACVGKPAVDEVRVRQVDFVSAVEGLGKLGTVLSASNVKEMALPYFDVGVVAGFPIPLDNDEKSQDIELLKMLCPHPEASYLIRVEGYSMIDAGIESGDIVIVDKSNRNPSESQVAVCEYNGEYTLKRFVMKDGVGWLVPANPDFPQIKITPEDRFSIWGTVTYIIHKPRY